MKHNKKYAIRLALSLPLSIACLPVWADCMDSDNAFWKAEYRQLYDKLAPHLSCSAEADAQESGANDAIACNYFASKVLSLAYGVTDFDRPGPGTNWPVANVIIDRMAGSDKWHSIGPALDQANLTAAAAKASAGNAVVAGMKGEPNGHVVVILPGKQQATTTWKDKDGKGLLVPNSASFFLNDVKKAYVFCRLSWSFTAEDAKKVNIYYRDKP